MKIAVSAESTVDLTKELLEEFKITTVPFHILLGDETKLDGEVTPTEIIEYVNAHKVLPKTSAVNEYQFEEYFTELLKTNDYVVHFSLSSEMSSAYNNAVKVAEKLGKVYVIDSRSLSTGIALQCIYARKLADAGKDAETIVEECKKRIPYVQASFALKRVDYLYKGGRCSSLVYLGANLLRIRPEIIVEDGKMKSGNKYRGNFDRVVESYCKDVLERFDTPDLEEAFVTYTTADDTTVEIAVNALKEAGFKNIHITHAGGTITSHCGENCLGILYINDGGKKTGD